MATETFRLPTEPCIGFVVWTCNQVDCAHADCRYLLRGDIIE